MSKAKRKRRPKVAQAMAVRDVLATLAARRQIDQAQLEAGREWQRLHALSTAGIRAIDPMREVVDGGAIASTTMPAYQIAAQRELNAAEMVLGVEGRFIARRVLGDGMTITELATLLGGDLRETRLKFLGLRLRECLTTLARHFGFAPREYQSSIGRRLRS